MSETIHSSWVVPGHYFRWSCLSVLGSSFCIGSSNGLRGGVTGSGLKWVWGMASNCGGETSLELLLFELQFPAGRGIGMKESFDADGGLSALDWSLLLERDLRGHFFFGLSTVDLERGLPIFGRSPPSVLLLEGGVNPSWKKDRESKTATGEEEEERLLGELLPPCLRLRIVFQRRGLELLKLKFLSESSDADMRIMGLWGTAGVRKVLPISSTCEDFLFRLYRGSSG